jgi:hypothetical protein
MDDHGRQEQHQGGNSVRHASIVRIEGVPKIQSSYENAELGMKRTWTLASAKAFLSFIRVWRLWAKSREFVAVAVRGDARVRVTSYPIKLAQTTSTEDRDELRLPAMQGTSAGGRLA